MYKNKVNKCVVKPKTPETLSQLCYFFIVALRDKEDSH